VCQVGYSQKRGQFWVALHNIYLPKSQCALELQLHFNDTDTVHLLRYIALLVVTEEIYLGSHIRVLIFRFLEDNIKSDLKQRAGHRLNTYATVYWRDTRSSRTLCRAEWLTVTDIFSQYRPHLKGSISLKMTH